MTVKIAHSPNSLTNNSTSVTEVNEIQVEHQTTENNVLGMSTEALTAVVLKELQGTAQTKPAKAEIIAVPVS